ncbi:MAG: WG repeat-containing protein [Tannerella sp.]|nr:WG repeat-containing protein [Tannerella sp.]
MKSRILTALMTGFWVWTMFSCSQENQVLQPVQDESTGKWGYVDTTGKTVIPHRYDAAGLFAENLAAVTLGGKTGYINKKGKEIISLKYEQGSEFSGGRAKVALDGKFSYINKAGRKIILWKYGMVDIILGMIWFIVMIILWIPFFLGVFGVPTKELYCPQCHRHFRVEVLKFQKRYLTIRQIYCPYCGTYVTTDGVENYS